MCVRVHFDRQLLANRLDAGKSPQAPSPEKPTSTWKSITDSPKPTLHLEDQEESVGQARNQPRDQVKGIHGCGANCPAICM